MINLLSIQHTWELLHISCTWYRSTYPQSELLMRISPNVTQIHKYTASPPDSWMGGLIFTCPASPAWWYISPKFLPTFISSRFPLNMKASAPWMAVFDRESSDLDEECRFTRLFQCFNFKVRKWKWESESEKVKVRKWKLESESEWQFSTGRARI